MVTTTTRSTPTITQGANKGKPMGMLAHPVSLNNKNKLKSSIDSGYGAIQATTPKVPKVTP